MSYTNKKVTWEKCYTGSEESDYTILLDANGDILEDVNLLTLITSYEQPVDMYGDSIENTYGDISRREPIMIKARKQPHESVLRTADGKELLTKSYFYVDPRLEPNALSIAKMDKLDGETVMERYIMCDLSNKPKMVRYITI